MKFKKIMILRQNNFLLFIFLLFIISCQKSNTLSLDKTIYFPLSNEIETLDPANSYDTVSALIVYQVYETLFEYDYLKRPYVLKPLLAEKMPEVSNDGLSYKISIKKNIEFHANSTLAAGRTVKAQDFITQIKRIAFTPTASSGWWLFDSKIVGINEFRSKVGSDLNKLITTEISGLKAIDDYTLLINLTQPYPQLLYALAMTFTSPIPQEAIIPFKNSLINQDFGTGPFKITVWNQGLEVVLNKFSNYHHETYPKIGDRYANENNLLSYAGSKLPLVDKIHFQIMKESQTRWLNFLSNKVDIIILDKDNFKTAVQSNGDLSTELKEKNIKIQVAPTLTYWWLAFNMNDAVVGKNLNLRQAIAHAVNIDDYINYFTNNTAQKANSIFPPGVPGYSPTHQLPYDYNIEKAKKYLKLAGYPDGKGLPVLSYDIRGNSTSNRQMGEFIQKELGKIGIKVQINTNTFPAFLKKLKSGDLQFWLGGWAMDYPDAENILQLLVSKNHPPGSNSSSYSNREVDSLIDETLKMKDSIEKFELMEKIQNQVNKDLPWVMLYYSRNSIVYHSRLKNFRYSDLVNNFFKYLDVKPE